MNLKNRRSLLLVSVPLSGIIIPYPDGSGFLFLTLGFRQLTDQALRSPHTYKARPVELATERACFAVANITFSPSVVPASCQAERKENV